MSYHTVAAAYGDQAHEVTRIAEQQKLGKRLVRITLTCFEETLGQWCLVSHVMEHRQD